MTSAEIRQKYLEFFKKRGHSQIESSSLVPEGDATTLFTGSGMQPLIKYLLGAPHPSGRRLVNYQKSFRSEDIEEVGDSRHTTFFEMLGNWSLGDYFKEDQLSWIFEFLTKDIGLDPKRIYVTVFSGDKKNGIPRDDESVAIWQRLFAEKGIEARAVEIISEDRGGEVGMQGGRIFFYSKKNWWSRAGAPEKMPAHEPGGPDSEMFYEFSDVKHDPKFGKYCHPNCDCGKYIEIGNSVFIQYKKNEDGTFPKLEQQNVDFGGGLERMTMASINDPDIFNIDTLKSLIVAVRENSIERDIESERIIADHLRASVFLLGDGVRPSNKDRGYIVRRLIRRLLVRANRIGISLDNIISKCITAIIEEYGNIYIELKVNSGTIVDEFRAEAKKFIHTLDKGLKEFDKRYPATEGQAVESQKVGADAFGLYQSFGFPLEVIGELLSERGYEFNEAEFRAKLDEEIKKHQEISRAGGEKKFGGHGLILDTGELKAGSEEELKKVTRLHTATHMLQRALREVLGVEVHQAGSDITVERTRFDFTFPRKLTSEEIKKVEDLVDDKIREDLPMQKVLLPKAEAEKTGALFFFKEKYPDPVNVYFIGKDIESAWSKEFCGGPHVTHTGEIGKFKIIKEEAVASGVRRIRATVE